MNTKDKVAVTSRSFSKNEILRAELLSKYSNVTFNEEGISLSGEGLINFLTGHTKAIIALEEINYETLSRLSSLKVVSKYGVGFDKVDLNAMKKLGIAFGWTGGINKRSVSELVLAFAINMLRNIPQSNNAVTNGIWQQHIGSLLSEKTFGIIGCGHVGQDLIKILQPFDCKILVCDIKDYSDFFKAFKLSRYSLEYVFQNSDIVSLHVPFDESTRGLISLDILKLMKPSAFIINTSRGGIVNEYALKSLLKNSRIAGAAFDVFLEEPPTDIEMLSLPNFFSTPHIGGSSIEAILNMGRAAITGLDKNKVPD
jgi:D-3-phosphoglycerate dehydrogenase